jgi:ABC-type transport system involved in multi-copper enzyme maturation permease subunit
VVAFRQPKPLDLIVYSIYFFIPHLEWYDVRDMLVHDQPLINWLAILGATIYAAVYTATFLLLAWLRFRRKPLNA